MKSWTTLLALPLLAVLSGCGWLSARHDPLVAAARSGDVSAIPVLVRNGADPNAAAGVNNWTVLMHAIHKNRTGSVRALLDAGADPNRRGLGGGTPLAMAAGYGQTEIVRILLEAGADPRMRIGESKTALDYAITGVTDIDDWTAGKCQTETVRLLLSKAPELASDALRKRTRREQSRCSEVQELVNTAASASAKVHF